MDNLSDLKPEDDVNDSLSAMKFCVLQLKDQVPVNSMISRFHPLLCEKKVFNSLLKAVSLELERHHLILKEGVKIDVILTDSPFRPKGKPTYEVADDRKEDEMFEKEKQKQSTVETFARASFNRTFYEEVLSLPLFENLTQIRNYAHA